MSRDDKQHGRYASNTFPSRDRNKGTAARVRPFSFEEIMMRRKSKESSQVAKEEYKRVGLRSTIEVVEKFSAPHEQARGDKDGKLFSSHTEKHASENRSSSGSKEEFLRRGGKTARGSHDGRNHTEESVMVRSRHKEEHDTMKEDVVTKGRMKKFPEPEAELRTIASNEVRSKDNRAESDLKNRSRSKHEEKPGNYEHRSKRNRVVTDRSIDTWGKRDQRPRNDPKDRGGKDSCRDQVVSDRYADRSGGTSEKEIKRKLHNTDDRKIKDRSASKKHDLGKSRDLGKSHDLEVSERKERKESLGSRYEEAMIKRKRSRSREREKDRDRDRRSISLSPKAHKHRSSGGKSHGELASHSHDDRLGKQHKDGEKSKFSSNGLGSNYHGQGGPASGLGGYSPRKRKTESAVKTPSPTNRSPEKKRAGWDIPPTGSKEALCSTPHGSQPLNLSASTNVQELVSAVTAALNIPKPPLGASSFRPTRNNASIDSIQLTESTRPLRRLYVANLPTSTSEKVLMEYLNHYLLSSGVIHIQGTQPCISCMIHREKCQALVEFLTPEDASAALSFDGSSFSGSILKIRRPKDFVDVAVTNGDTVQEARSAATPSMMSDIVIDSPHKIFIGGISEVLSAEMVMEIVRAFGPLKAFHLETEVNSTERYAFIEYVDPSVTHKACAGLNGMKLGGQILTVVQAVPDPSSMECTEISSTYTIPDHAKPLLERPTTVLKLKNVFTPEEVFLLSKRQVEEVVEDIRLECARFGTVKSVNVVQQVTVPVSKSEEACGEMNDDNNEVANCGESIDNEDDDDTITRAVEHAKDDANKVKDGEEIAEAEVIDGNKSVDDDDVQQHDSGKVDMNHTNLQDPCGSDLADDLNTSKGDLELESQEREEVIIMEEEKNFKSREAILDGEGDERVFEAGVVFVEYKRREGSCLAAHCLHGRLFEGGRVVMVEYVPLHLYRAKFCSMTS